MTDLEPDLAGRLRSLADDLTAGRPGISAAAAVARHHRRRRTRMGLVAVAAAVGLIAVGVPTVVASVSSAPSHAQDAAPHAVPTSTTPTTPTTPTVELPPAQESTAASSAAGAAVEQAGTAAEQADLAAVAATLDAPLPLSSPTGWDQWLPAGKPYPGADTADDISTCPHLAAGLGAALGVTMSYWTGTLPQGPVGCTWVPVPLQYDGPYSYAYLLSVGFLADGSTPADWRAHFYQHQGQVCPVVDVPAVGDDAFLVRCDDGDGPDYTLVLRDARTSGLWFLEARARPRAPYSSTPALGGLVVGVRGVYG